MASSTKHPNIPVVTIRQISSKDHLWLVCKQYGIGVVCYGGRKVGIEDVKKALANKGYVGEFTIRNLEDHLRS
jgi:hypothetical protein